MNLKPVKLLPAFKDYLWGGVKLKADFGKKSNLDKVAESWELSMHKDGQSTILEGNDKGLTLSEYIDKYGKQLLGKDALAFDFFPILIKFIDAADNLSVQVHPSDEYALKNEGEYGKTEMWYILDCEDDAHLYYGVKSEISKEEFTQRIKNNTLLEVLNKVKVKKGDVFFINAGTIHAIGKGIVICEIQQNSNTTYRVYDYDRRDKNGNPRDLHIEKAIDVSTLVPSVPYESNNNILAKCKYFTVEKLECTTTQQISITKDCFKSVIVVSGSGKLMLNDETLDFCKGDSIFIPAQDGIINIDGICELIISYV
ncbi:MAG: class I mannose-6-phosphate isomerase [Ruminococcaceae bacterium]|nr:class I mannose-6-phosphate isomerase [Oscillospiraceae bacterium]